MICTTSAILRTPQPVLQLNRKTAPTKIGLAQINPTIGDFEHNTEKMMTFIEKAKGLSCDLIIFSELVISGYPPRDLLERQDFIAARHTWKKTKRQRKSLPWALRRP